MTLKAKSESFQEDHMGWFQREGLFFLPWNIQWKLVNSLLATTHLGGKTHQRLLERSFRGTGLKKKLLHEIIRDLVFPGHYKVTVGHHLFLRPTNGSLKHWGLLMISTVPGGLSLQDKSQAILKISNKKDSLGDLPGMEGGFTNSSHLHLYCP